MTNDVYTSNDLLKLIFSSKAVTVWNNKKGPVFWYAAGVPGPFYVNTEKVIGAEKSENLLARISSIVQKVGSIEEKAETLHNTVMNEYSKNQSFRRIVATMIDRGKGFDGKGCTCVSGGERRDWFFSIPYAHETQKDHLFIFKDHSTFRRGFNASSLQAGNDVLHVSDLIHNAASYFDNWLPTLKDNDLNIIGTVCVINRGRAGLDRLEKAGVKALSLKGIDLEFFNESLESGLVDDSVSEELHLYFKSREDWAKKYILSNPDLFDVASLDKKSKERLKFFVTEDPWKLENRAGDTFTVLRNALGIEQKRLAL